MICLKEIDVRKEGEIMNEAWERSNTNIDATDQASAVRHFTRPRFCPRRDPLQAQQRIRRLALLFQQRYFTRLINPSYRPPSFPLYSCKSWSLARLVWPITRQSTLQSYRTVPMSPTTEQAPAQGRQGWQEENCRPIHAQRYDIFISLFQRLD